MGGQIVFRFLHISDVHFRFRCADSFENVTREMIKEKILLNPTGFYHKIITYALNNEEEQFNADNV